MYDMYPEWGPARNNPDHPSSRDAISDALQSAFDLRDERSERPDDN
jgi:hypothetical protein